MGSHVVASSSGIFTGRDRNFVKKISAGADSDSGDGFHGGEVMRTPWAPFFRAERNFDGEIFCVFKKSKTQVSL